MTKPESGLLGLLPATSLRRCDDAAVEGVLLSCDQASGMVIVDPLLRGAEPLEIAGVGGRA